MPRTGLGYSTSVEGRQVDRLIVAGLTPILRAGEFATGQIISRSEFPELSVYYDQTRIGQHGEPFEMHKLQTLRPGTAIPLSRAAEVMRRRGPDELGQLRNIEEGQMSFFGHRPLIPEEYEEVLDNLPSTKFKSSWQKVIDLTLPGILSSYGIHHHIHPHGDGVNSEYDIRAILDIHDAINASTSYNIGLLATFAKLVARRGF